MERLNADKVRCEAADNLVRHFAWPDGKWNRTECEGGGGFRP